jgi:4-hydroxy-tetrahydrodipicolinate reductase
VIEVAVPGAAGKMGRMVLDALRERSDVTCVAAVERPGHPEVGREAAPGVVIGDDLAAALGRAQVYIDFTAPSASAAAAELAADLGVAAVIGTTGVTEGDAGRIRRAAQRIPIVWAPNFSLGVNLVLGLVEQAARTLGPEFDLEVVEIHHKAKRDAPSGTAIAIGQALARGRDTELGRVKRYAREGDVGARPDGEIGMVAVRGGDVVGEHTAYFLGPAERIEITHRAGSRAIFARGAVRAATWVVGKPAGLYGMKDVLGL